MRPIKLDLMAVLLAGACCLGLSGCASTQPAALGQVTTHPAITEIGSIKHSSMPQTIAGTMIGKCPMAGCWFYVKDSTGVMKVDTKSSGFVVVGVPIRSHVVVTGVVHGDDNTLIASGLTYQ